MGQICGNTKNQAATEVPQGSNVSKKDPKDLKIKHDGPKLNTDDEAQQAVDAWFDANKDKKEAGYEYTKYTVEDEESYLHFVKQVQEMPTSSIE